MNKYINKISKKTVLATQAGTVWILTEENGTPIPFTPENDYFTENYTLLEEPKPIYAEPTEEREDDL